ASLTLRNFQLWQVGLLAVALRDLADGRVPLGFARSRGLGRVSLDYGSLEISYPGQFLETGARDFGRALYGVTAFVPAADYGYVAEQPLSLPVHATPTSEWGRVSLVYDAAEQIESVLKATVAPWSAYVQAAGGGGS
ncbi:MAG: hypothetical protein PVF45_12760, partial [Anaerolineae bacterium]